MTTQVADPDSLSQAQSAVSLHARVAGQAAPSLIERSKIPEKLEKARAAIQKSRDRAVALDEDELVVGEARLRHHLGQ